MGCGAEVCVCVSVRVRVGWMDGLGEGVYVLWADRPVWRVGTVDSGAGSEVGR